MRRVGDKRESLVHAATAPNEVVAQMWAEILEDEDGQNCRRLSQPFHQDRCARRNSCASIGRPDGKGDTGQPRRIPTDSD